MLVRIQSPDGVTTRECEGYNLRFCSSPSPNEAPYYELTLIGPEGITCEVPQLNGWAIYIMNDEGKTIDSYRMIGKKGQRK
jgi:hypothetical protein